MLHILIHQLLQQPQGGHVKTNVTCPTVSHHTVLSCTVLSLTAQYCCTTG
jgi:hypothetical protein